MTVNERLFACGLLTLWDSAVRQLDRQVMVSILRRVAIAPNDAESIAARVLTDPS
jgi:hypothetical protein